MDFNLNDEQELFVAGIRELSYQRKLGGLFCRVRP